MRKKNRSSIVTIPKSAEIRTNSHPKANIFDGTGTSREVGVNLKQGYNGDLTSKQAGSVGGQMVKKMIQSYENGMKK